MQPVRKTKQKKQYQYLMILITLFITTYILTAIVQSRLVTMGSIYISAAIFVYPISYLICDIVTEIYGYRVSRQLIWCGLLSWIISGIFITIIIGFHSPAFWIKYAKDFNYTMSPLFRSVLAGSLAVISGQFINIYVISKLKILVRGKYFWLRSVGSSLVGNTVTNIIALCMIFLGRMTLKETFEIVTYEIIIDIIYSAVIAFPAVYLVSFLKRSEGIDTYDHNIDFNPFKFKLND